MARRLFCENCILICCRLDFIRCNNYLVLSPALFCCEDSQRTTQFGCFDFHKKNIHDAKVYKEVVSCYQHDLCKFFVPAKAQKRTTAPLIVSLTFFAVMLIINNKFIAFEKHRRKAESFEQRTGPQISSENENNLLIISGLGFIMRKLQADDVKNRSSRLTITLTLIGHFNGNTFCAIVCYFSLTLVQRGSAETKQIFKIKQKIVSDNSGFLKKSPAVYCYHN